MLAPLSKGDFLNVSVALAMMAIGVVVDRAQRPILCIGVPFGPSIARHKLRTAFLANHPNLSRFPARAHSRMMARMQRE